jgi:hypothetical protein
MFDPTLHVSTIARDAPPTRQHSEPNKDIISSAQFGFSLVAPLPNV